MEKILVGKVVSTHGIKGEIRIISNFQFKDRVFQIGNKLIIGENSYTIKSYRHHKEFEMVTLDDYTNINDVLFLMNKNVFFDKNKLSLASDEVLDSELVLYDVLTREGKKGIIKEIFYASPSNKIMRVKFEKEVLIPFNSPMIVEINKKEKQVIVDLIVGM